MRYLFVVIPLVLMVACDRKPADTGKGGMAPPAPAALKPNEARDPICQMAIDKETAKFKTTHEGSVYYFCAEGCLKKFQEDPKKHAQCCLCAKTAKKCDCGHCSPKGETCDCHS